jgi:hypothetical protein
MPICVCMSPFPLISQLRADTVLLQASAALVATFAASLQSVVHQATRSPTAATLVAAHLAYHTAVGESVEAV